ncbi:Cytochrome c [Planctomycetes bacterium Pan216]|uniref:Cytochrome c n=1 Tax=Kolteria novifilia TaxID=2527975 RepID=A0A518B7Z2_9BACT|nr:Cytochrome c [Planctomycetes bacterium Pan216]
MSRRLTWLTGLSVLLLGGCGINLPGQYPLASYTRAELIGEKSDERVDLPPAIREELGNLLVDYFGTPKQPGLLSISDEQWQNLIHGQALYQKHCIHCHGLNGGGNGPTAPFLFPRPRDYRRGVFKWKSTTRTAKPTREDLLLILKEGAIGTSMPPFRLMPEKQLNELVDYVIFLSMRGEFERKLLQYYATEGPNVRQMYAEGVSGAEVQQSVAQFNKELAEMAPEVLAEVQESWRQAGDDIIEPNETMPSYNVESEEYEASLQRGKELYLGDKAACYKCHNRDGRANVADMDPSMREKNVDDWGQPNYPRNLLLGMYRGGRRPVDLFRRIHQGIAGAQMPAGGSNLKPREIWDIVNFVRALPYRPSLLPQEKPKSAGHGHGHGAEESHAAEDDAKAEDH